MSEDKDIHEENTAAQEEQGATNSETIQEETPASEPTENSAPSAEDKYNELNDRFLRLYAEFDNYRRRTNKEKLELIESAGSSVLKAMLPTMDDFDRAIANNEKIDDVTAIKEGFVLIYNKLKTTLESKGLKAMTAKGETFDSELHEAIANVPAPEEALKGKVIEDVEKGYYLNEKVLRFAKVVVGN